MRRRSGRRGHQTGYTVQRLPAPVLEAATMAGCGGGRKALAAPDGSANHRDLVELVTAVVVAQSGRACARTTSAAPASLPAPALPPPAAAAPPATAAAPKRLHQPLGARRHSTEVIQPSGSSVLPAFVEYTLLQPRRHPPTILNLIHSSIGKIRDSTCHRGHLRCNVNLWKLSKQMKQILFTHWD